MCHWISTPGHGFLYLSPLELKAIPENCRRPDYEEDCEWSIAVVALPSIASQVSFDSRNDPHSKHYEPGYAQKAVSIARVTLRNWYPDLYEQLTGEPTNPQNSTKRADQEFDRIHKNDWVVICASGDWKAGVPKGYVGRIATLGGKHGGYDENGIRYSPEEKRYFVSSERYSQRSNQGYVIQPDDLEVSEGEATL